MFLIQLLLFSLTGALILMDKWPFGNFGLSQPLVSCSILGLIFNQIETGIFLGITFQLLSIGELPLGRVSPFNYQLGAIGSFFLYRLLLLKPNIPKDMRLFILVVSLGILLGYLGKYGEHLLKEFNGKIKNNYLGLLSYFLSSFLLLSLFLTFSLYISPLISFLPLVSARKFFSLILGASAFFLTKIFFWPIIVRLFR